MLHLFHVATIILRLSHTFVVVLSISFPMHFKPSTLRVIFFCIYFLFKSICKVHQTQETSQAHKNRHTESFHKQNVMNVFLLSLIFCFCLFVCLPIFTIVKAMGFVNLYGCLCVCVYVCGLENFSSFIRLNSLFIVSACCV